MSNFDELETIKKGWFNKIFDKYNPSPLFVNPLSFSEDIKSSSDIPGCIINSPKLTLSIPLLDFAPVEAAHQLLSISKVNGDTRDKHVCATVRGMGGGKTRAFEEIRRILLLKEEVLPIAITFNHKSAYDCILDDWSCAKIKSIPLFYTMSVISRILSAFFDDMDLVDATDLLKSEINSLSIEFQRKPDFLIQEVIKYLMERISTFRCVDTFILLIDETMRIEEEIQKTFNQPRFCDATNIIRTGLLNKDLFLSNGNKRINIAMAISSLMLAPTGMTTSSRPVIQIPLPSQLNTIEIVNKIFEMENRTEEEKFLMRNVASTVNKTPRLVEIMRSFIKSREPIKIIDHLFIYQLYEHSAIQVDIKYGLFFNTDIPIKILWAIVFGGNLDLRDSDTLDAIKKSIISNSLNDSLMFIDSAETSVMMLWRATKKQNGNNNAAVYIHRGLSSVISAIINSKEKGDILETSIYEWMKIRIATAKSNPDQETITIAKLMGLNNDNVIPKEYEDVFNMDIKIYKKQGYVSNFEFKMNSSSYDNMTKVREFLDEIDVSLSSPIILICPAKGEAWDLGLVIYNPVNNKPFYIFIDTKSACEDLSNSQKPKFSMAEKKGSSAINLSDFPKNGEQFIHTQKMMESRSFVYYYMKSHNIEPFVIGNAVEIGREECRRFFGSPLFDLYLSCRSSLDGLKV